MAEAACCPKCGMHLAPNAPQGICPGCLFQGALEAQASLTADGQPGERFRDPPPTPEELESDFPDLEILEFVGRGGMGMVYKARQKHLDRVVALKILSPHIARDAAFAERFAREARVMALLTHPHVVAVYDFGTALPTGEREVPLYYFLMEFVDGLTLRQLLNAGELAPPQAFAIVPQICEALQFAHDKGVVHRDIKPENILLDRMGNVKIADFGLAKLMGLQGHDVTLSTTGQVLGTLHYMAPEQMEHPLEVDHRADIYSLGVVFYQMLTGELPLGHFAPPSRKASVDARLDEVVLRALAREPGDRYQQASALQSQVETIVATGSDVHEQPHSHERRKSWFSAGRARSRAATAVVVLAVICLVGAALMYSGPTHSGTDERSLADAPDKLRQASTARVIEAGIKKPLSPWAWQELEHRTITGADAEMILDGLTAWLRREHPEGMSQPLSWLDKFLEFLDRRGLVSEQRKISFLEALHGDLRGERSLRLREGAYNISPFIEWGSHWDRDLMGMTLMNQLQSATIDGQTLAPADSPYWNSPHFFTSLPLPKLSVGKHALRLSVLSALVLTPDLAGLKDNAPASDWPSAKKRWVRTVDLDITVYPLDAEIIGTIQDPSLDPATHGLSIESLIIRGSEGHKNAGLKFQVEQTLPVPIAFDVSLHLAGQTIPCGKLSVYKIRRGGISRSETALSADIPQIGEDVKAADVVLTPNPKLIELRPEVDRIWGGEVVFRNVAIRRLDATGP